MFLCRIAEAFESSLRSAA
ncbi:hypothetical protein TrRE_jg9632, partial [Triparma retinervis]